MRALEETATHRFDSRHSSPPLSRTNGPRLLLTTITITLFPGELSLSVAQGTAHTPAASLRALGFL